MHTDENGSVEKSDHNPLLTLIGNQSNGVTIDQEELFNEPSPHMTPAKMLQISNKINAVGQKYDGIVVTHGTDTLEETAYFLDLTTDVACPVAVTGAMRSTDQIGADGISNIRAALTAVLSPLAHGQGVMVVLDQQIHAARYVTKSNTTSLSTFKSPEIGPLGEIIGSSAFFYSNVTRDQTLNIDHLATGFYMFKAYAGMDDSIINLLDITTTHGIVIEGMGAGNLPPKVAEALQRFIDADIPVILVSRCYSGQAVPVYAYDGGGVQLVKHGFIISRYLNGQKALIRLRVGVSAELRGKELADYLRN